MQHLITTFFLIFNLFSSAIYAQEIKYTATIKEEFPVKRKLGKSFAYIYNKDLGELTYFRIKPISIEKNDEVFSIEFVLWYCAYHDPFDIEKQFQDCKCEEVRFSYFDKIKRIKNKNRIKALSKKRKVNYCINEINAINFKDDANSVEVIFYINKKLAYYVNFEINRITN